MRCTDIRRASPPRPPTDPREANRTVRPARRQQPTAAVGDGGIGDGGVVVVLHPLGLLLHPERDARALVQLVSGERDEHINVLIELLESVGVVSLEIYLESNCDYSQQQIDNISK